MTVHDTIKSLNIGDSVPAGNMTNKEVHYARVRFRYKCIIKNGMFTRICPTCNR